MFSGNNSDIITETVIEDGDVDKETTHGRDKLATSGLGWRVVSPVDLISIEYGLNQNKMKDDDLLSKRKHI